MKYSKTLDMRTFLKRRFMPSRTRINADDGTSVPRILARYAQSAEGEARSTIAEYAATDKGRHLYSIVEDLIDRTSEAMRPSLAHEESIFQDDDEDEYFRGTDDGDFFGLVVTED